jgi:hypothetical protein
MKSGYPAVEWPGGELSNVIVAFFGLFGVGFPDNTNNSIASIEALCLPFFREKTSKKHGFESREFLERVCRYVTIYNVQESWDDLKTNLGSPQFLRLVEAIVCDSSVIISCLKEVIKSRTLDTYEVVQNEFCSNFDSVALWTHFQNVNEMFPHRKPANTHLYIKR